MHKRASGVAVGLVVVIVGVLMTRVNQAQTPAPAGTMPVGVVDLVRVFNEFEQTKALNAELDRYKTQLSRDQQQREEKLTVERDTLQGFAPDSAEYRKRSAAMKKMIVEYQAWLATEREMLKDEHRRWIERTYDMVTQSVAQVALRKGLQLVFTREELETNVDDAGVLQKQILNRKVVYYDPGLDVSDDVLVILNDAFAKAGGAKSVRLGAEGMP
ncbi:MAG TPA: OmpH family outer membrane protein [Phycisphaerae bacterium]|nr:OmpH family outer membrane protein [Phycisphaerae bacterium]